MRYGERSSGFPHPKTGEHRWKYYYQGITYITDVTSRVEVTSWVDPLELSQIDLPPREHEQHALAKQQLEEDPSEITSHSVSLIIAYAFLLDVNIFVLGIFSSHGRLVLVF